MQKLVRLSVDCKLVAQLCGRLLLTEMSRTKMGLQRQSDSIQNDFRNVTIESKTTPQLCGSLAWQCQLRHLLYLYGLGSFRNAVAGEPVTKLQDLL